MSSQVPYLIRAIYDWVLANNQTPHISVDATVAGVEVPQASVKDGHIVLNISPTATKNLHMGDGAISFNGRFGGREMSIYIPIHAIRAIYGRESSQGMILPQMDPIEDTAATKEKAVTDKPVTPTKRPSFLKVIK